MWRNWYKTAVFLLFIILSFVDVQSQEYDYIFNETKNTKLQNHSITSIVQDLNGFLWIGTNLGLYRYDGYDFTPFNISSKPSQLDNHITTLLTHNENLWIGSDQGIHILNTTNYKITSLTNHKNDTTSIPINMVSKLYKDKQNTIWVCYNTNQISKYLGNNQFKNFTISSLSADFKLDNIFETFGNSYILKFSNNKTKITKIIRARLINNKFYIKTLKKINYGNNVLFNFDYKIYLIENNNIFSYNSFIDGFKLTPSFFNNTLDFQVATYFKKNAIYLGTSKSSFYKLSFGKNISMVNTIIDQNNSRVNNFLVDKSGILWVGTSSGLYKLKKQKKLFNTYLYNNQLNKENEIRSIIQDYKENIYAINQNDIFQYNFTTKKFDNLNWLNNINSTPFTICEYDNNNFLVGFQGGGIGIYNKKTTSLKNYFENKSTVSSSVLKLFKDKNNIVWIGTLNGLNYYDQKKDTLIKNLNLSKDHLKSDIIFDIKLDSENNLWVGTNNGLFSLKVDYSTNPLTINSFKIKNLPYEIHSILINKNILWLTTKFNGLLKYNTSTKKTILFNESKGLSVNTTYSILPGKRNELWIGTSFGLSRFDTIQNEFMNFFDYNGLAGSQSNSFSQLKTKTGQLFFGGKNGITSFFPVQIAIDSTNYPLNLVNINWYNTSEKSNTIKTKINNQRFTELKIPFNNAFITFEFSLADYFKPTKNHFKYRLIGFLNEWKTLNNTNKLSYTNIPPGKYLLEVLALNADGNWNKETLRLPITVNQIYYKRWWFILAVVLFFGLLLFLIRKYELSHILKMENLRIRIARDLHDELGSILTGIAIKSDLLLEKIKFNSKKEILKVISEQSRIAVDSLSDIVWAIDSKNNSIQELSDRMESLMYQFLSPLNISITYQTLQNIKNLEINQDYRQHVFLIFKEAITNIIKHSNASLVFVSMVKKKSSIKLTIADNGTKITTSKSNLNGNGINNMTLRAEKIKGKIKFSNDNGYTVELNFPYKNI